ncbi:transposable element Tcb2 transposase [Trichonephila clavipes]|nr:transposable element Tcb2 transposase [Trichonephila clavipes]
MAQTKYLNDFLYVVELLDDWNVGVSNWKYPSNFESPRVSSPGFRNDSKIRVMSRCYSTGRPRVTTPNEDRYIYLAVTAKRNGWSTASDLSRQLSSATGTTVSRQTVYKRLGHIGLYARRPLRCVPLTSTHCRLQLNWSTGHALWTPQQWSCVMFSDKAMFILQSDSHRTLI